MFCGFQPSNLTTPENNQKVNENGLKINWPMQFQI